MLRRASARRLAVGLAFAWQALLAGQPALTVPDYSPLQQLPRWEGTWNVGPLDGSAPPFGIGKLLPEKQRLFELASTDQLETTATRFCRMPQFAGITGGISDSFEVLFTPGRVTFISELGLVRRIPTDGRQLQTQVEPTRGGTSVGRWEGATLVVETTGLMPDSPYLTEGLAAVTIGHRARISERITLLATGELEFDVRLEAPELLAEPERRRIVYRRARPGYQAVDVSFCSGSDRTIDPATGRQRFEMTPPADLPPPPPR